jgi:hypothetical protein
MKDSADILGSLCAYSLVRALAKFKLDLSLPWMGFVHLELAPQTRPKVAESLSGMWQFSNERATVSRVDFQSETRKMGGLVAVGLIANGDLKTVVGHTNTLSETIKNRSFVDGDISLFESWFDRYGIRNLPENMDDEAFGFSDHVPSEYGYVLVDLNERTIVSAQDYTSFTTISGPRVESDGAAQIVSGRITFDENDEVVVVPVDPYASVAEFEADPENDPRKGVPTFGEFFDEVRALVPDWRPAHGQGFTDMVEAAVETLTKNEAQALLKRAVLVDEVTETAPTFYSFETDFGDWSVFDGSRNADDFETVRDYLADRGYLTDEMTAVWNEAIAALRPQAELEEDVAETPAP